MGMSIDVAPGVTPIAFAIAGHHAGLSNLGALSDRLRTKGKLLDHAKQGGAPAAILAGSPMALPAHVQRPTAEHRRLGEMWTRMVFSALCDADFLDTETFYDAGRAGRPFLGGHRAGTATALRSSRRAREPGRGDQPAPRAVEAPRCSCRDAMETLRAVM